MARPERKTVDYFPHYISDGKKMFYIEQKYGNDGYASWFKILESLASTDDHFLNLNNQMDLLFLSAKCRIQDTRLLEILNDLSMLGEIDEFLWLNKIVYSHKFVESIQDAYTRRTNKCMDYDSFCIHYRGLCTTITLEKYKNSNRNTQSKVKETKVKESKQNESKKIPSLNEVFEYVQSIEEFKNKFESLKFSIQSKYEQWIDNGWKDGHNVDIKNWKTKIKNTLPHLKPINNFNTAQNGNTSQQRRTLDEQVNDLTARVLGINPEQSTGKDEYDSTEEADCSMLE